MIVSNMKKYVRYGCALVLTCVDLCLQTHGIWGPFLVVAPASTLHNWQQEISKFMPSFKVLYHFLLELEGIFYGDLFSAFKRYQFLIRYIDAFL